MVQNPPLGGGVWPGGRWPGGQATGRGPAGEVAVGCGAMQPGVSGASTLRIGGLRADQGRDAHNASNVNATRKARHARSVRR